MAKWKVILAAENRGAVITKTFESKGQSPWPGAMMVLSRAISAENQVLRETDRQLTVILAPVDERG